MVGKKLMELLLSSWLELSDNRMQYSHIASPAICFAADFAPRSICQARAMDPQQRLLLESSMNSFLTEDLWEKIGTQK